MKDLLFSLKEKSQNDSLVTLNLQIRLTKSQQQLEIQLWLQQCRNLDLQINSPHLLQMQVQEILMMLSQKCHMKKDFSLSLILNHLLEKLKWIFGSKNTSTNMLNNQFITQKCKVLMRLLYEQIMLQRMLQIFLPKLIGMFGSKILVSHQLHLILRLLSIQQL